MHNKFEDIISEQRNREGYNILIQFIKKINNGNRNDLYVYVGTGLSFYYQSWGEPFELITRDILNINEIKLMFPYIFSKINGKIKEAAGISDFKIKEIIVRMRAKKVYNAIPTKCDKCVESYHYKKSNYSNAQIEANRLLNTLYEKISNNNEIQDLLFSETKKCLYGLYEQKEYLLLGDLLNDLLVIIGQGSIATGSPFNYKFAEKINNKKKEINIKFDSNRSIFLIPYLSDDYITTNVDNSISIACNCCDKGQPHVYYNKDKDLENKSQSGIVHIHGEISDVSTFIMTAHDYNVNYMKDKKIDLGKPLVGFLQKVSEHNHLIFIGASLSEHDLAIQTMEEYLSKNIDTPGSGGDAFHHIAFFKIDNLEQVNYDRTRLFAKRIFPIFTKRFEDQATFIREALREVKNAFWNQNYFDERIKEINLKCKNYCFKNNNCNNCLNKISCSKKKLCKTCEELSFVIDKITSDEPFQNIGISKAQISNLLCALKPFLYDDKNERTFNWRLCVVDNPSFYLGNNKDPSIYNLPLGNTIYFINDNLNQDRINTIVTEIQNYCNEEENFHRQIGLKVRVIYITDNSFSSITEEQIQKILLKEQRDRIDEELKTISERINNDLNEYEIIKLITELSHLERDQHRIKYMNHANIIREYKEGLEERLYALNASNESSIHADLDKTLSLRY